MVVDVVNVDGHDVSMLVRYSQRHHSALGRGHNAAIGDEHVQRWGGMQLHELQRVATHMCGCHRIHPPHVQLLRLAGHLGLRHLVLPFDDRAGCGTACHLQVALVLVVVDVDEASSDLDPEDSETSSQLSKLNGFWLKMHDTFSLRASDLCPTAHLVHCYWPPRMSLLSSVAGPHASQLGRIERCVSLLVAVEAFAVCSKRLRGWAHRRARVRLRDLSLTISIRAGVGPSP